MTSIIIARQMEDNFLLKTAAVRPGHGPGMVADISGEGMRLSPTSVPKGTDRCSLGSKEGCLSVWE